jgi:hypothetical protein
MAMPETEPAPDGTCSAYAAQLAPTRSAAGSAIAAGDGTGGVIAMLDELGAALPPDASAVESFEHAAAPKIATALKAAAANFLR